jgi:hypothetical protein
MRLVLTILVFSSAAWAQIRPFQTTRLMSSAGAGVGSLLVTESAILNPASVAFFSGTDTAYQKVSTSLKSKNPERAADGRAFSRTNRSEGFFLFDNQGDAKGGVSLQQQRENAFYRQRMTGTMASMLTPTLSFGLTYRHTEDRRAPWAFADKHKTSHSVVAGISYVVSEKISLGVVWEDVGRATPGESKAQAGIQLSVFDKIALILDGGADPAGDLKDNHLWRAAIQLQAFNDFLIRGGRFQDNTLNQEGFAWGGSWAGPKLGVDVAFRESNQMDQEKGYLYPREKITDFSFTMNLRF